jgi:putative aldouronate transport system permease protein
MNSLYNMVTGTVVSVLLTMLLAYPAFAPGVLTGARVVTKLTSLPCSSPVEPSPLLVVRNLGIYDTRWAIILPNAITVWNVIIARTFLQENISDELCTRRLRSTAARIFASVLFRLPLKRAIVAVLALFYAVGQWNKYFDASCICRSRPSIPCRLCCAIS